MQSIITRDPDILGGVPVFENTRVPIKNLFDCLEKGYTVGEFLEDFPAVSSAKVSQLFREVENSNSAQRKGHLSLLQIGLHNHVQVV